MTNYLDAPPAQSPAERLRTITAATRVSLRWLGVRKALTQEQTSQAADAFEAESAFLSAAKKILDVRHPAFKTVTAVKHQAISYWKGVSLPFVEAGVRLVRHEQIEPFDQRMSGFRDELARAVAKLDEHYGELRQAARRRLGRLYNPADYPETLRGSFDLEWSYPSVEPPSYLQELSPELYRQECARVQQRFDEAVELAEQAFLEELRKLIAHLTERLSGQQDGRPKVFRDSAVENLQGFFESFQRLNIGSNQELDDLVEQARQVVFGVEPQNLRENRVLRQTVAQELSEVQTVLDGLVVDRPRRNILRRPK
jgi:hypothetical protein